MSSKNKSFIEKHDNPLKFSRMFSYTLSYVMLKVRLLNITHQFTRKPGPACP